MILHLLPLNIRADEPSSSSMNADVQSGMEETWLDFLSPSTTIKSGQTVKTSSWIGV